MDDFLTRLALQFRMKPAVAIQIHRRQMEDAEIARHPGGFADIDFEQAAGQPGQGIGQQAFPCPA